MAVLTFIGTAIFAFRPKLTQRQTVTSHNKPIGHIEPQWAADQKNLTGAYANLSDEQLASWNMDARSKETLTQD